MNTLKFLRNLILTLFPSEVSMSVEIITDFGCLKDPIRFLPYFELIPVFLQRNYQLEIEE